MHAAAFNALRTAQRPLSRRACRTVAGIRHPLPRRNFHRSAIAYRIPTDPASDDKDARDITEDSREKEVERPERPHGNHNAQHESERENANIEQNPGQENAELRNGQQEAEVLEEDATNSQKDAPDAVPIDEEELADEGSQPAEIDNKTSHRRTGRLGSGRIRPGIQNSRRTEGLPRFVVPDWFFKKNVKCAGEADLSEDTLGFTGQPAPDGKADGATPAGSNDGTNSESKTPQNAKYVINADIYREIELSVKAGLYLRPPKGFSGPSMPRPAILLHCPKDGGTLYLDSVVERLASDLGADLVRLDADDIAQIVGTYADENIAWGWSKFSLTSLLGYDAQKMGGRLEDPEKDMTTSSEEDADAEDPMARLLSPSKSFKVVSGLRDFKSSLREALATTVRRTTSKSSNSTENSANFELWSPTGDSQQIKAASDQWTELKATHVLNALIRAVDAKRTSASNDSAEETSPSSGVTPVIVHVRDYKELNETSTGMDMLSKLRVAVNKRWFDGRPFILVGTTSYNEEFNTTLTRHAIQHLQSDILEGQNRTIYVPPSQTLEDAVFESDEKARIRSINIRHVEDMVMKLADGNSDDALTVDIENGLDNAAAFSADLEDAVWAYPRVHRLATTILGQNNSPTSVDGTMFNEALKLLAASDEAKFAYGEAVINQMGDEVDEAVQSFKDTSKDASKAMKDKLKKIRTECSPHEKKLLAGVITPSDIHTTFSDVRAPKETVEALKTLTSLSLIRPEAFSYGVLATDKIPGLLLYGPPGTGKTLLAKAVAKESGATVLEVSGAEVSDMYVGEGEKNVKAIFSLAKKLSPCVVFIDEADSLLGSRSGEFSKRSSHREVINQFLREWDGLKDLSAFIMVATNRPFDLDDAVLRRLPRRLLVDLPVEADREAILAIHLKDETLDHSVSLATLAKDTPFYSGSDLKNVSVAAAMACIREENEEALKHTGEEPYVYPPKRTLMKHHFERALQEISASVSDEMSTLSAIRKFDEKYGDRRGRRKKAAAMGFGGTTVPEKDSEAARVRNLEV